VLVVLACSEPGDEPTAREEGGPLAVAVVNDPLAYFAHRIGGEHVEVVFPVPRDVDPALWSPDGEAVAVYQDADLILLNGAGYAAWVQWASLPRAKLVDTSAAFADRLIPVESAVTHQHGPRGEHSHGGTAFTTWLDPTLAMLQARAIADALVRARPEHEAAFRAGLDALEADLRALDERLRAAARRPGAAPVFFSHPVYQYLERRYGLDGRSVHWEPDQLPDAKMWHELENLLEVHSATVMIWEAEPLEATARRLEAFGLRSVVFDPGSNTPPAGDWLAVMHDNAARLEALAPRSRAGVQEGRLESRPSRSEAQPSGDRTN
jgi:zinc transport system substrate-binding protein